MKNLFYISTPLLAGCLLTSPAWSQSSTLGVDSTQNAPRLFRYHQSARDERGIAGLDPGVAMYNALAVHAPPPREFARHDQVTVIIRETIQTNMENESETEVESSQEANIIDVPYINDLLNTPLNLGLDSTQEWESESEKSNSNSVSTRITAQVIDVLPNGYLILEARKMLQLDSELHEVLLSGICRPDDISGENTVLSTQLGRFTLRQITQGDLHDAVQKGWITQIFDTVFGF